MQDSQVPLGPKTISSLLFVCMFSFLCVFNFTSALTLIPEYISHYSIDGDGFTGISNYNSSVDVTT
jgi:hypothetical protein